MKQMVRVVNRIDKGVYTVEKYFSMAGLIALVALVTIQVLARYLLQASTPWTEELARYVFLWTTYVGCGMCFSKKKHVVIDLMDEFAKKTKNPKKFSFIVEKLTMIVGAVFLIVFLIKYGAYFAKTTSRGPTSTALKMPMAIPYASVIAGCILMLWHSFVICIQPFEVPKD